MRSVPCRQASPGLSSQHFFNPLFLQTCPTDPGSPTAHLLRHRALHHPLSCTFGLSLSKGLFCVVLRTGFTVFSSLHPSEPWLLPPAPIAAPPPSFPGGSHLPRPQPSPLSRSGYMGHLHGTLARCLPAPDGSDGKESPAVQETQLRSLGGKDPLEKEMATHSSILA